MDRDFDSKPRFTQDEMSEILETAARLDGVTASPDEISLDELTQIATELGISPEAVEQVVSGRADKARAERELLKSEEAEAQELARKKKKAWRDWRAHVASFIAVMLGIVLLDLVTGPGAWWYYPAIGWGMGLGVHTLVVFFNAFDDDEDE